MPETMQQYVVFYSGGILSYATLRVLLKTVPAEHVTCLFTDTSSEDPDLYRFLVETTNFFDVKLAWLRDGRNIWEVMHDKRFLANSRFDICSHILKRAPGKLWLQENTTPRTTTLVFGMDWSEQERVYRLKAKWEPQGYTLFCPLASRPYYPYETYFQWLKEDGIPVPALYKLGFTHNNCGGFCVKAGKKHFRHLLNTLPERYAYHENEEARLLQETQTEKVTPKGRGIIKHQTDGYRRHITLADFRQMEQSDEEDSDVGSCGCFLEDDKELWKDDRHA